MPTRPAGQRKFLGQILKEMELVSEGQIQEALAEQRKKGGALGEILLAKGYIDQDTLTLAIAAQNGMEVINLDEIEISSEIIEKVPKNMAMAYTVLPVRMDNGTLVVAMSNPNDINAIDDLRMNLRCDIRGAIAPKESIQAALEKYYGQRVESISRVIEQMSAGADDLQFEEIKDKKGAAYNVDEMINAAPVVKLLNLILITAIKAQASDIHFEPFEDTFRVRYRVDGVLYEMQSPPLNLATAIITRIKVLSNMDISETRLPQDGRILLSVGKRPVDLRVSTLPCIFGESVVMRVLDRSVVNLELDNLGLREDDLGMIKKLLSLPHGIIIVTGPTGSGKTTSLYSCLNFLNDLRWKIITTEDPVEYDIDGIIQCQVNDDIGVTYASLLRSILRQDPDVILVGEIRDLETSEIAIEASLTGHQVFSTLHTNDAPSAITRLVDLGVEPYLICATLEAIVAQRLIRRICAHCKDTIKPTEEMLIELNLTPDDIKGKTICYGKGCQKCNGTGYRGRLAIFEIMLLTDRIKQLILHHSSTEQVRIAAREQGMRSLRESGLLAIFDGHSTIEEVIRETMFAEG
jgi:type IV pilus assembly protein PilB